MIVDTLDNLCKYTALNPLFNDVVEFIKANDLSKLETGKHLIKETDLFVNIQDVKGKTEDVAKLETHRRMIDIQIPLSAPETFGYTPLCSLPDAEYNDQKDITKYEGRAETYFTCRPGEFAAFFPQDGHAPCIAEVETLRKAIFKVRV